MSKTHPMPLTYYAVIQAALPIIIVQITTPLTGLIDVILIGRLYDNIHLAAIGLGTLIFNFVYWSFGFLRMSTTALTVQIMGQNYRQSDLFLPLVRNMLVGLLLGVLLIISQIFILKLSLYLSDAEQSVKAYSAFYFKARIWGAPAELVFYVVSGWLVGQTRTKSVLYLSCFINLLNILFSILFAGIFKAGLAGVGTASALAYGLGLAVFLFTFMLKKNRAYFQHFTQFIKQISVKNFFNTSALKNLFFVNFGIMIRTLTLLYAFAHFINASAQAATNILAANQILLQFIAMSAYLLDAFAFIAESLSGQAYIRKDKTAFLRAVKLTSLLSLSTALISSLIIISCAPFVIRQIAPNAEINQLALNALPLVSLVPLIGIWAYQLDGIFIGSSQVKILALAGLFSLFLYLAIDRFLFELSPNNQSLWLAFLIYYGLRAFSLALAWPVLMKRFNPPVTPSSC